MGIGKFAGFVSAANGLFYQIGQFFALGAPAIVFDDGACAAH